MSDLFRYSTKILRIEERFRDIHVSGSGDHTTFHRESTGWWIVLDCGISMPAGNEKPNLTPGASARLSLEELP